MRLRLHLPEGTSEWESDVALFRIGRADSCALRFEGESAKYAGWEHAEFITDDQGRAYITDLQSKNGTYLDGVRISEPMSVRVGTIVQIGTKGPKLEVLELTPPERLRTAAADSSGRLTRQWVIVGVAAALLVVIGVALSRKGGEPPAEAGQPQANLPSPDINDNDSRRADRSEPVDPPEQAKDDKPPAPAVGPPQKTGEAQPRPPSAPAQAFAAYRLIVAEDPESHVTYPLSGAVAIADHTLLTTAAPTVELAKFVEKKWPLRAMKPSNGQSVAIRDLRIHPLFQQSEPADQPFFDAALLYTDEPLTDVAELPTDDDLERLELGRPLTCVAADHDRIPFKGVRELTPTAHQGIIAEPRYQRQSRAGGVPGLLVLKGRFHDWYFGSPIVNDRGHLVAIYCEQATDNATDKHFAKVIDPELIRIGLNERDSSIWVPVTASPDPKESAK